MNFYFLFFKCCFKISDGSKDGQLPWPREGLKLRVPPQLWCQKLKVKPAGSKHPGGTEGYVLNTVTCELDVQYWLLCIMIIDIDQC